MTCKEDGAGNGDNVGWGGRDTEGVIANKAAMEAGSIVMILK